MATTSDPSEFTEIIVPGRDFPVDDRDLESGGEQSRDHFQELWDGTSKPWVVLERLKGTRIPTGDIVSQHEHYEAALEAAQTHKQEEAELDELTTELGGRCINCDRLAVVTDLTKHPECPDCGNVVWDDVHQRELEEYIQEPIDFNMFWGAASGSQRKALRVLSHGFDERETGTFDLMVNYATKNNQFLTEKGLELLLNTDNLFIDSGGYSFFEKKGEYTTTDEEYLNYIARVQPDRFALRDYPCEPDILEDRGSTVEEHQRLGTEKALRLLDLMDDFCIHASPVAVIQGWAVEDYLAHIDQLEDAGVLDRVEYVGIGTLCGREDVGQIASIVTNVRERLGDDIDIHGFGIKRTALGREDVLEALDSADTLSYSMKNAYDSISSGGVISNTWKHAARSFLEYYATVHETINKADAGEMGATQETLGSFGD